jgi:hypothetical protein
MPQQAKGVSFSAKNVGGLTIGFDFHRKIAGNRQSTRSKISKAAGSATIRSIAIFVLTACGRVKLHPV